MKTIENEPNISRHENGNLYFVARRNGKLTVKSLKTADLAEARRKIREMGTLALTAKREPEPPAVVSFEIRAMGRKTGCSASR